MKGLFELSGTLVLPFWLLMIFFPKWKWTKRTIASVWICAAPAVIYGVLVIPKIAQILPVVARPELADVMRLLSSDTGTTIAWLHFLSFDLFVGRWAYLDSLEKNVSRILMAPVLFLILMLGPIGLVLYLLIRTAASRHAGFKNEPALGGRQ